MYSTMLQKHYNQAKEDGRLCPQCGGIITKPHWKKGFRICWFCYDANKGVNVTEGHWPLRDEIVDMTGEE